MSIKDDIQTETPESNLKEIQANFRGIDQRLFKLEADLKQFIEQTEATLLALEERTRIMSQRSAFTKPVFPVKPGPLEGPTKGS